ncbi:hypothetical protein TNCT_733541 [Trichonephila clavata]|uniref:Uncharacterized protein n=1 Tax=Trichonephila clavata TaxID=2740835 RepID=A0A8X6H6S9_TRICU|nr:hypothetical protein TNCT_733541 [Trichonephila clavata]
MEPQNRTARFSTFRRFGDKLFRAKRVERERAAGELRRRKKEYKSGRKIGRRQISTEETIVFPSKHPENSSSPLCRFWFQTIACGSLLSSEKYQQKSTYSTLAWGVWDDRPSDRTKGSSWSTCFVPN